MLRMIVGSLLLSILPGSALAQPADIYIAAGDLSTFGKGLERCGPLLAPFGERAWIAASERRGNRLGRKRSGFTVGVKVRGDRICPPQKLKDAHAAQAKREYSW